MAKSFRWTFSATAIQGLLQLSVTIILARLLAPADYGTYAVVDIVITWAGLLSNMGLGTVLIQKTVLSNEEIKAARILALGLAISVFGLVAAGAPLLAIALGTPSATALIRIASLSFLINGVGLTYIAVLRRNMQFGRLGAAELGGYMIGNVSTSITLALLGYGVWSVVIGNLAGLFTQTIIAISLTKVCPGFSTDPKVIIPVLRSGSHVALNTALDVVHLTMDTFIIARLVPQSTLGVFNRASMLSSLPGHFINNAISRVIFSSYSRLSQQPTEFMALFKQTKTWSTLILVAIPLGMIPAADTIVTVLLGKAWLLAPTILRILLIAFAFEQLSFPYHNALDALGHFAVRTRIRIMGILFRALCLIIAGTLLPQYIFWVGVAAWTATWAMSVLLFARTTQELAWRLYLQDLCTLIKGCIPASAVLLITITTEHSELNPAVRLVLSIAVGAATLAATVITGSKTGIKQIFSLNRPSR